MGACTQASMHAGICSCCAWDPMRREFQVLLTGVGLIVSEMLVRGHTRSSSGALSGTWRLSPRRVIFIITCTQGMFGQCSACHFHLLGVAASHLYARSESQSLAVLQL